LSGRRLAFSLFIINNELKLSPALSPSPKTPSLELSTNVLRKAKKTLVSAVHFFTCGKKFIRAFLREILSLIAGHSLLK
jgi:hypothetical protein